MGFINEHVLLGNMKATTNERKNTKQQQMNGKKNKWDDHFDEEGGVYTFASSVYAWTIFFMLPCCLQLHFAITCIQ